MIAEVADGSAQDATHAVDATDAALHDWQATAPRARAQILRTTFDLMHAEHDQVAALPTLENGKSLADSHSEIVYAADFRDTLVAMHRDLEVGEPVALTPLPVSTVQQGSPEAGSRKLAALGVAEVGLWEMTPGAATDVEVDEVFVVLRGDATVAFDDGESIELGPGSVVRLRAGDRTVWTVRETLRKIYIS